MFRFAFYQIPFMRNGTSVPALAAGTTAVSALEKYKKIEIVTPLQFSETQAQVVINNGDAIADSGANYMRVARTTSQAIGDYSTDAAEAFYWVDDVQLLAAAEGATPAAVVTFSPDVWLTDFYSKDSTPAVNGRILQTSLNSQVLKDEPRRLDIEGGAQSGDPFVLPYLELGAPSNPAEADLGYVVFATFINEFGGIVGVRTYQSYSIDDTRNVLYQFSHVTQIWSLNDTLKENVQLVNLYALPELDYPAVDNTSQIKLITESDTQISYECAFMKGVNVIAPKTLNITVSESTAKRLGQAYRKFLLTPKKIIELKNLKFEKNESGEYTANVLAFRASYANRSQSDSMQILLFVNNEIVDVSDDFMVDFAVNEERLKQSQNKQLYALQSISSAIAAIGGAVGGFASGNYFGATQAIIGGVENIASRQAALKQPAHIRCDGNAAVAIASTGLFSIVSFDNVANNDSMEEYLQNYGYTYDNAPPFTFPGEQNVYYKFQSVEVSGITGGQYSAHEIAQAFLRGVRLKTL